MKATRVMNWRGLSPEFSKVRVERALLMLALWAVTAVSAPPAVAGVGLIDKRDGSCLNRERACMSVYGYISMADAEAVHQFLEGDGRNASPVEVYLNSPGGDVEAAIAIGRRLRAAQAVAYVFSEAQCSSSCVFLLAGATLRVVDGAVAVHRPIASGVVEKSPARTQVEYQSLLRQIEEFFRAMNVSERLFDVMIGTPPEDAKYLTARELSEFGLTEDRAVGREAGTSRHQTQSSRSGAVNEKFKERR
jgi:hypothetical protein